MARMNTEKEELRLLGESKAMAGLTERQKNFIRHLLETGSNNMTRAAAAAGYTGDRLTLQVTGHRLAHDPKVQAAMQEEAKRRMNANVIMATSKVAELIESTDPRVALKAAEMVMNRGGVHATTEVKHTHELTYNSDEMVQRLQLLAKQLGMNAENLLGSIKQVPMLAPPIEGEFEEVQDPDDTIPEVW